MFNVVKNENLTLIRHSAEHFLAFNFEYLYLDGQNYQI
jgi:hypothetical protein